MPETVAHEWFVEYLGDDGEPIETHTFDSFASAMDAVSEYEYVTEGAQANVGLMRVVIDEELTVRDQSWAYCTLVNNLLGLPQRFCVSKIEGETVPQAFHDEINHWEP